MPPKAQPRVVDQLPKGAINPPTDVNVDPVRDDSMNPPSMAKEELEIPGPTIPTGETPGVALAHVPKPAVAHPADKLKEMMGVNDFDEMESKIGSTPDHFAAFIIPAWSKAGKSHRITIEPEETVVVQDASGNRKMFVNDGSGKDVIFDEGAFATDDMKVAMFLLQTKHGYGLDYVADKNSPFWQKLGAVAVETKTITVPVGEVDLDRAAASLRDESGPVVRRGPISTVNKGAVPAAR